RLAGLVRHHISSRATLVDDSSFGTLGICLQPREDLRPPAVPRAPRLCGQSRVRQSNDRDTLVLVEINANKACLRVALPIRQPREHEQVRSDDLAVLSSDPKGLSIDADTTHRPSTAGTQIGFHVRRLKRSFRAPPLHPL